MKFEKRNWNRLKKSQDSSGIRERKEWTANNGRIRPVVGTADMYNIAGANYVAPNAQQSKKNTTKKKDSHR